jgi:hypothetical protein
MNYKLQHTQQPMITASEVGEFVFCAKAWHPKRGGAIADSPRLASGLAHHARHGARLAMAVRLRRMGLALAWIADLLLVVLLVVWYFARAS